MVGLFELEQTIEKAGGTVEAAALRLHSLYTGVKQILLMVSRVSNGVRGLTSAASGMLDLGYLDQTRCTAGSLTAGLTGALAFSPPSVELLCCLGAG